MPPPRLRVILYIGLRKKLEIDLIMHLLLLRWRRRSLGQGRGWRQLDTLTDDGSRSWPVGGGRTASSTRSVESSGENSLAMLFLRGIFSKLG